MNTVFLASVNLNFYWGNAGYSYHFNGKESDNDWTGNSGDSYDFGARMYDTRLGRWKSIDPRYKIYADHTPYCFSNNNPIYFADPSGEDAVAKVDGNTITISSVILIMGDGATEAKAAEMQTEIMGYWGKPFTYTDENGKVYNVKYDIKVVTQSPPNVVADELNVVRLVDPDKAPEEKQMDDGHLRSYVDPNGWYGQWDSQADGATYAHEAGHLLGFDDRYYEYKIAETNLTGGTSGMEGTSNYKNTDSDEIMGLAAADPKRKPKVTQKDTNAMAKYVLANYKGKGLKVNLSHGSLNSPTIEEQMDAEGGGMRIVTKGEGVYKKEPESNSQNEESTEAPVVNE